MSLLSQVRDFFRPEAKIVEKIVEREAAPTVIIRESKPEARYESAFTYFGERSLIAATLQDARFDYTPGIRCELQRKSRFWERNDGIYQRIIMLFEQYVAGATGLPVLPNSGDLDWNKLAKAKWDDWCKGEPELDGGGEGNETFADTQTLIARNWFVDGEVFIYLTHDPATQEPKIQLIEAHRVGTPSSMLAQEGTNIIDGVEINPITRKRLAFHVRRLGTSPMAGLGNTLYPFVDSQTEEFQRIPANLIIHVYKRQRPGLMRGIPPVFCVGNDIHDLSDLQQEEMKAVKSAADLANVWHTKTGEPVDTSSFRTVARQIFTQDSNGNPVSKPAPINYDVTQGGRDKYLKIGEDVKQFATERPTVATRDFWDYLTFRLCAGMGISRLLVAPYAPAQGTVVRSDMDTNNTFFRSRSRKLASVSLRVYVYVMGYKVDYDRDLMGSPKDWKKAKVRPPRSLTADVGRNSSAMIEEYNNKMRTLADIYAENGQDYEEALEQRTKEEMIMMEQSARKVARAKELAAQYGVPIEQILPPAPKPSLPPGVVLPPSPPIKAVNGHSTNGNGHALLIPSIPESRLLCQNT